MVELTLIGLRILREVAARGSFTAAATALRYTQSSISRQIATLEAAAGAPLFERVTNGVRLTEAGRVLLRHADGVLGQLSVAQTELRALRDLSTGRLRVGAFPTATATLVPRVLAALRHRHPGVAVELREGVTPTQLRALAEGSTEIAIISGTDHFADEHFAIEALIDDPLLLAVSRDHVLATRRAVELGELADEQWIFGGTDVGDSQSDIWQHLPWQPRVRYLVDEWTAKLGLVAAGLGLALVPGLAAAAVRDDIALLRLRTTSRRPATRTVALATRAGTEAPPTVRVFVDLLHEVAAELQTDLERRVQDR